MIWPFDRKNVQRDARVTQLEEQARDGEVALVQKIMELDRRRIDLDRLTADALKDLGRPHRA